MAFLDGREPVHEQLISFTPSMPEIKLWIFHDAQYNHMWLGILWSKSWQRWVCSGDVISSSFIEIFWAALGFLGSESGHLLSRAAVSQFYVVLSHTDNVKGWSRFWLGQTLSPCSQYSEKSFQ